MEPSLPKLYGLFSHKIENNELADLMENLGAQLNQGTLVFENKPPIHK